MGATDRPAPTSRRSNSTLTRRRKPPPPLLESLHKAPEKRGGEPRRFAAGKLRSRHSSDGTQLGSENAVIRSIPVGLVGVGRLHPRRPIPTHATHPPQEALAAATHGLKPNACRYRTWRGGRTSPPHLAPLVVARPSHRCAADEAVRAAGA